jgi:subtilase family serine protease
MAWPGDGTGQTIAIVEVGDNPSISGSLHTFDQTFGLPDPVLTEVAQDGGSTVDMPAFTDWQGEIDMDVEWAHAIAPGAHILIVEAKNEDLSNEMAAVDYARNRPGVGIVSMSFGFREGSFQTAYDATFSTPAGHLGEMPGVPWANTLLPGGVTFVASSGDSSMPQWPATNPNVLAVGGTILSVVIPNPLLTVELGWQHSGGGISAYEPAQLAAANGVATPSASHRTTPDVAAPAWNVSVFDSRSGWWNDGGTSAGAPMWAGLIAVVNQGRSLVYGEKALQYAVPSIYAVPGGAFNDIQVGISGSNICTPGYDLVTGRGSPRGPSLVWDMMSVLPVVPYQRVDVSTLSLVGGSAGPAQGSPLAVTSGLTTRLSRPLHAAPSGYEPPVDGPALIALQTALDALVAEITGLQAGAIGHRARSAACLIPISDPVW